MALRELCVVVAKQENKLKCKRSILSNRLKECLLALRAPRRHAKQEKEEEVDERKE